MYSLIIIFAVMSPATASVIPIGTTSHIVARFDSLEHCKAAANETGATGAIVDLSLTRGVYWHCVYSGPK